MSEEKSNSLNLAVSDYNKKNKLLNQALVAQNVLPKTQSVTPVQTPTQSATATSNPASTANAQATGQNSAASQPQKTQSASKVSYVDPNGATQNGYIINGVTYTDEYGQNPVPVGSTVTDSQGRKWYKGANGSYQITATSETNGQAYSDLSPLINQSYDKGDQMIKESVAYQTQRSADQLNRALQDAQPNYEAAIANQLLETKQAQDAKAYRNQINGDRGGIGSAQVDSIGNVGAANREAIAQQQRQLATDTARQIADLRAQGKYEEASQLLQNNQARLAELYNEQVRLQSAEQSRRDTLAALGQSYLQNGLMPNADMLKAMGIDAATAKRYVDLVRGVGNASENYVAGDGRKNGGTIDPTAVASGVASGALTGVNEYLSNRDAWHDSNEDAGIVDGSTAQKTMPPIGYEELKYRLTYDETKESFDEIMEKYEPYLTDAQIAELAAIYAARGHG